MADIIFPKKAWVYTFKKPFPMQKGQFEGFSSPLVQLLKSPEYPRDLRKCDSAVIVS